MFQPYRLSPFLYPSNLFVTIFKNPHSISVSLPFISSFILTKTQFITELLFTNNLNACVGVMVLQIYVGFLRALIHIKLNMVYPHNIPEFLKIVLLFALPEKFHLPVCFCSERSVNLTMVLFF